MRAWLGPALALVCLLIGGTTLDAATGPRQEWEPVVTEAVLSPDADVPPTVIEAVQAGRSDRYRVMLITAAVAGAALIIGSLGYLYRRRMGKIRVPTEEEYLAAQHALHSAEH